MLELVCVILFFWIAWPRDKKTADKEELPTPEPEFIEPEPIPFPFFHSTTFQGGKFQGSGTFQGGKFHFSFDPEPDEPDPSSNPT